MAETTPRCNEAADAFQAIVEEISSDTSSLNFDELCNMMSATAKEAGSKLIASPVEEERIKFKPGCEAHGLELQRCIDGGDVDPRSAAGQRFAAWRSKNPDEEAKYKSFKGVHGATALKKQFRLKWAETDLGGKIILTKSKKETLEEKLGEEGEYMAFDRIVVAEGGSQSAAAVARAVNYTKHALAAGRPFVEWNTWKEATEILYCRNIRSNVFSTA